MSSRRRFLGGMMAAGLMTTNSWAGVGNPTYLSAARRADGAYFLVGLDAVGGEVFRVALPARGHAAAAHPERAEAVAFARRPGTYALVLDCVDGSVLARLQAAKGRHFYGHGAFSTNGERLFTTENDYENGQGVIGVWDVRANYRRIGEFASAGVGPHEILRLPGRDVFAVANGGIDTHPDSGRAKLNLHEMAPNLSYFAADGALIEQAVLPAKWHKNSIRHLAVSATGRLAFAMQWQGEAHVAPPLLGLHRLGENIQLAAAPAQTHALMGGYAGSVAFSGDGGWVAISSPRGGLVQRFDAASGAYHGATFEPDVCGISTASEGVIATSGQGRVFGIAQAQVSRSHALAFDNHLVAI